MPSITRTKKELVLNEYACPCGVVWYTEHKIDWFICSICLNEKVYLNEENLQVRVLENDVQP